MIQHNNVLVHLSRLALGLSECQDEEEIAVTNPFLKRNPKDSLFDQALEAMQVLKTLNMIILSLLLETLKSFRNFSC